tara:strand:- start:600 stop:1565 length:966 start_codon:yes stop_codon:yes gene_type:complete
MASGTWNTGSWGQNQWNDNANPTPIVTGFGMSAALGDESSSTEVNVGWGRQEWGLQGWGIAGTLIPTGISATFNLGSVTTSADANTGPSTNNNQTLTTGLGTVTAFGLAQVSPTGIPLTNSLGTVDAGPDAMAVGIGATMGLGTVEAFNNEGWGRLGWSINDWGDAGSSVQADVSGIAMTGALGTPTEITGGATVVANTLNVAQLTLGAVDPAPDAAITGNFMIGALGTLGFQGDVAPTITGFGLTANLGNETIDLNQQVNVTGNPLLARVASVTAFTNVTATFNGFGLTATVGSGNALIWNEINTGSAPIDPPGWREVVA